jgi:hypothetical protein
MEDFGEARVQKLDNSHPKPERMEETLEGGRGPPRAVAPLERERKRDSLQATDHTRSEIKVFYTTEGLMPTYKPLFVTYCQYNCETGVLLHDMKRETFHLKVAADCSITIHSKKFTGAEY